MTYKNADGIAWKLIAPPVCESGRHPPEMLPIRVKRPQRMFLKSVSSVSAVCRHTISGTCPVLSAFSEPCAQVREELQFCQRRTPVGSPSRHLAPTTTGSQSSGDGKESMGPAMPHGGDRPFHLKVNLLQAI